LGGSGRLGNAAPARPKNWTAIVHRIRLNGDGVSLAVCGLHRHIAEALAHGKEITVFAIYSPPAPMNVADGEKMSSSTDSATLESPEANLLRPSRTLDASLAWANEGNILDEEVRRWFERNQVASSRRSVMGIHSVID
jgi:hypothetical protein